MNWDQYYKKYSEKSDSEIKKRVEIKKDELRNIFDKAEISYVGKKIKVAVLGCADKRMVKAHKEIFENILKCSVDLITFDVDIQHLTGEEDVVKHDCAKLLPDLPYDLVYSHVLLKFLEEGKQWDLIKNSYDVLRKGGYALHLMDKEDYDEKNFSDKFYFVPIKKWEQKLKKLNVKYKKIYLKYGLALILIKF